MNSKVLRFDWAKPDDWGVIGEQWQSLESCADISVFLSWTWVETWATVYKQVDQVCRVYSGPRLVAMGLWAKRFHKRPLGLNVTTFHLQHCGSEALDQIWPEYNELLCLPEFRESVHAALLDNLPTNPAVSEVDLGVCDQQLLRGISRAVEGHWLCEERWQSPAIAVEVSKFDDFDGYLESLSNSFRYQLRRSERGLEKLGPLRLNFADTSKQAVDWFLEDGQWHKDQWGQDSGFYNEDFVRFHTSWIARSYDKELACVVRLMAGDQVVSGAYLLRYRNTLYFYLGFARQEWGPKVKSGLCLHLFLIRFCLENEFSYYDFMGGDFDYKRKFGQPTKTLVHCRFKPKNWKNRCEQKLKFLKFLYTDRARLIRF